MSAPNIGKCSICKKPTVQEFRPFCSKRCAQIDLGRWLGGHYVIAGNNADSDEDGERPQPENVDQDGQPDT